MYAVPFILGAIGGRLLRGVLTFALKHGVWLVMPPEFIVPGEQGVPFGSGFQIGPQATEGAPTCPPLPFRQRSNVPEGWAGVGALSQL